MAPPGCGDSLPDRLLGCSGRLAIPPDWCRTCVASTAAGPSDSANLDKADRETIAVVVSAWNRCTYCVASHGLTEPEVPRYR